MPVTPYFLDVEASGLAGDSYPIRVVWTLPDGSREGYYIRPDPEWTHWEAEAEAIHRIPRDVLFERGQSATWVLERMNAVLAGCTVYLADPGLDGFWMRRLFEAARVAPAFELASLWDLPEDERDGLRLARRRVDVEPDLSPRDSMAQDAEILTAVYHRGQEQAASPKDLLPCFIDFEASGLTSESYPIEVAWSMPDGTVESHYIDPAPHWDYWDPEAEAIHWIPRHLLRDCGRPVAWIAERMNAVLAGHTVYCDAPGMDRFWMNRLFDAAGVEPAFELGSFWAIHPDATASLPPRRVDQILQQAEAERGGRQHEADSDVRYLMAVYRLTLAAVHERETERNGPGDG
ncbi:hypothetical protein ACNSTU_16160 [Aquisalimonas sp. APHAB1-3]|uniref:hypothetical protein n=1 Tax=Aquisalimonas sp. APHAB1-3 TaxID=3402080 RepID=UPI003AB0BD99